MSARDRLIFEAFSATAEEQTRGKCDAVLSGKCASLESYKAETAYIKAWTEAVETLSKLLNKDFDTDLGDWNSGAD